MSTNGTHRAAWRPHAGLGVCPAGPQDRRLYRAGPSGHCLGDETAHVIFLLAISKSEYEEAMAIYDLFVTFLRERAMPRLRECRDFDGFLAVATECVTRF